MRTLRFVEKRRASVRILVLCSSLRFFGIQLSLLKRLMGIIRRDTVNDIERVNKIPRDLDIFLPSESQMTGSSHNGTALLSFRPSRIIRATPKKEDLLGGHKCRC